MDGITTELIAMLVSIIVLGAVGSRVGIKTTIDLLHEVRDARRENIKLQKQNIHLIKIIQQDRTTWTHEKAEMQAQINKLIKALRILWERNREQAEQIETLAALKRHYQDQLTKPKPKS